MRKWLSILGLTVIAACNKKKDPPIVPIAGKAAMVFPLKSSVCTEGKVLSKTESRIRFDWSDADNSPNYLLTVNCLDSNYSVQVTTADSYSDITLKRSKAYSWKVTSIAAGETSKTESDTWTFYNPGDGQLSSAPLTPYLTWPERNERFYRKGKPVLITLYWSYIDPDKDLQGFDLYLGTTLSPPLIKADLRATPFEVNVEQNGTYYWKVVCKDKAGNSSESSLSSFIVYD